MCFKKNLFKLSQQRTLTEGGFLLSCSYLCLCSVSKSLSHGGRSLCCQIKSPRCTAYKVRLLIRAWQLIGSSQRICRLKHCGWPTTSSSLGLAASRTCSASACPAGKFLKPDHLKVSLKLSKGFSATRSKRPRKRAPKLVENWGGLQGSPR